jgi:hypothetical protein
MITNYRMSLGTPYVTWADVRAYHGAEALAAFTEWMRGQTMSLAENGDHMVYAWDYQRWVKGLPIID